MMATQFIKCEKCPTIVECKRKRKKVLCNKCYNHHYNTSCRNKKSETLRVSKYRDDNFASHLLTRFKAKAKREKRRFNLDLNWFEKNLKRGTCPITHIKYEQPIYKGKKGTPGAWTPSVDRIDNSKGYTKSNCRLVAWIYNLAKNHYSDEDVLLMSQRVLLHHGSI